MRCSIYGHPNFCPAFGGGHDIVIVNNSNRDKISYSFLSHSYGKNEGANQRDLTKQSPFCVKRYQVF
jgi:hypothetical protein